MKQLNQIKRRENEEFYLKYRYFQLHKWEILKQIKKQMLESKNAEIRHMKMMEEWIIRATMQQAIRRCFQRFDRNREIEVIMKKQVWVIKIAVIRIKRRIRR